MRLLVPAVLLLGPRVPRFPGRLEYTFLPRPLEGEDWSSFFADVVPLLGVISLVKRQRLFWIGMGGVKRLLVGERHPLVHLVVEGANRHSAVSPYTIKFIKVAGLSLVDAIQSI